MTLEPAAYAILEQDEHLPSPLYRIIEGRLKSVRKK